jgi:hypothetical protein
MALLAITAAGLADALRLAAADGVSVWCGADAISDSDFAALRGRRLSRFIYPLQGATSETLARAKSTLEEHHPGETIWVEGRSDV